MNTARIPTTVLGKSKPLVLAVDSGVDGSTLDGANFGAPGGGASSMTGWEEGAPEFCYHQSTQMQDATALQIHNP